MRIRGTAFQVNEKYQALARDASASGDRIMAENYLQHAEHYYRIISAINESQNQSQQQSEGRDGHRHRDGNRDNSQRENGHRDSGHRDAGDRDAGHREAAHQDTSARENGHRGGRAASAPETPPSGAEAESEFGKDPRQDDARDAPAEQANGEAVIEVITTTPAGEPEATDGAASKPNGADAAAEETPTPKPRRRGPGRARKSAAAKESAAPAPEANTDGD